jgi:molecular chaperone GrpE
MNDDYETAREPGEGLAPDLAAEVERLREELAARTREVRQHEERALRTMAEFDNARKRAERERLEHTRFANETLIRDLLPVLDNLDRALAAGRADPAAGAMTAGVELIQREFLRVLEKYGVTPFTSIGERFDPERHEAIARVPSDAHEEMSVVSETTRGYLVHGRVLRPSAVAVAVPPEPAPDAAG